MDLCNLILFALRLGKFWSNSYISSPRRRWLKTSEVKFNRWSAEHILLGHVRDEGIKKFELGMYPAEKNQHCVNKSGSIMLGWKTWDSIQLILSYECHFILPPLSRKQGSKNLRVSKIHHVFFSSVTSEATLRGISSVLHKQRLFCTAAEASQILATNEKHITSFRTAESNPVSICYFVINFILYRILHNDILTHLLLV